jgi:hypothetical protein
MIFPFTNMCVQYLHHIHTPTLFPQLLLLPTVTTLPTKQDLFHPPLLWICRKKMTLLLFFPLFIYSYVHTLFGSFLPPLLHSFPLPSTPLASRQNLEEKT